MRRYEKEIQTLKDLLAQLGDEHAQVARQVETSQQAMVHAADQAFDAFNAGYLKMITGGQSFARTMQQVWTGLAESFISAGLRTVEQMIVNAATQKAIMDSTKLPAAEKAARDTYASVAAIPYVGWILAPEAAAAAFAAVLAFEKGGVVPGAMGSAVPIIAHSGEAVLPAQLTSRLNDASGGMGGGDVHLHYSPTVHAIDSTNMSDALKGHAEEISSMVMSELRRANQI